MNAAARSSSLVPPSLIAKPTATRRASTWRDHAGFVALPTLCLFAVVAAGEAWLWSAAWNDGLSMVGAVPLATLLAYLSFTVMHDASHGAIAGGDPRWRGVETMIGWLAGLPLAGPFVVFRQLHLRHHAHTNDPEEDPDHWVVAPTAWGVAARCLLLMPRYYYDFLFGAGSRAPAARRQLPVALGFVAALAAAALLLAASGRGGLVLWLGLVPALLAGGLLGFAFDWLPHHPHTARARYHDTRILLVPGLTPLLLWQNYHLVHHLYPRVPFFRYGQVFRTLRHEFEAHGAVIEGWQPDLPRPLQGRPSVPGVVPTDRFALRVEAVERRGGDVLLLTLRRLDGGALHHRAGQYLRLFVPIEGVELARSYSLCNAPDPSGRAELGIKRVPGGRVSEALYATATEGDTLWASGPEGRFCFDPSDAPAHLVLLGGGSGVTPLLAMARAAVRDTAQTRVTLVLGNRAPAGHVFAAELDALTVQARGRLRVVPIYEQPPAEWTGAVGRLDAATLQRELAGWVGPDAADVRYALCGPAPMMEAARATLLGLGVDATRILEERFTAAVRGPSHAQAWPVRYRVGGRTYERLVPAGRTFLQAALDSDVPLAWSCGAGSCGSCQMRLIHGTVEQPTADALLERERRDGVFLACSAWPTAPCEIAQR